MTGALHIITGLDIGGGGAIVAKLADALQSRVPPQHVVCLSSIA